MTFSIFAAAVVAAALSLVLLSGRQEPRRIPVRVRQRDGRRAVRR